MEYLYLVATLLFVIGIKGLTSVKTCGRGNRISEIGMLLAILTTVVIYRDSISWWVVVSGVLVGSAAGVWIARTTKTTQMPEMVGALNGCGGFASALVAIASILEDPVMHDAAKCLADTGVVNAISVPVTILIGMVTLTGSFVAYFKLGGKKLTHPLQGMQRHMLHVGLGVGIVLCALWQVYAHSSFGLTTATLLLTLLSAALGVLLVIPIGGADMPVVISLLNSYSGMAGAASGFVINNPMLVVVGSLVGTSGLILTQIMCKAMNRSLGNVLVGGLGDVAVAGGQKEYESVKSTTPEEVAMLLEGASSVIVVPGYGLAVAQAQHVVRELGDVLLARGCSVRYAIHPVAGRMPGHMNVLLAESDVPYEHLWEMERINADFKNTDVVIVVGANDVVNPAAREATGPIAGMPILDVDQARTVIVIKRSLAPGYSGIKNPLFERDNCLMVFQDAKEALEGIVKETKALVKA